WKYAVGRIVCRGCRRWVTSARISNDGPRGKPGVKATDGRLQRHESSPYGLRRSSIVRAAKRRDHEEYRQREDEAVHLSADDDRVLLRSAEVLVEAEEQPAAQRVLGVAVRAHSGEESS